MLVKVKDVGRDAPVVVTVAPINSRQSSSPTLPSELVPCATRGLRSRAEYIAPSSTIFIAVQ
jgi:hypothetical protein